MIITESSDVEKYIERTHPFRYVNRTTKLLLFSPSTSLSALKYIISRDGFSNVSSAFTRFECVIIEVQSKRHCFNTIVQRIFLSLDTRYQNQTFFLDLKFRAVVEPLLFHDQSFSIRSLFLLHTKNHILIFFDTFPSKKPILLCLTFLYSILFYFC